MLSPNYNLQDGVVFACEKIVTSKLYEAGANRRITNIDTHVGMAAAGLVTDARQLAEIARFVSPDNVADLDFTPLKTLLIFFLS